MNDHGRVFIVGAGPGAEDLITIRGLRALRQADVVFYDALVNPDLLSESPGHARKVFVGKRCGRHALEQDEINRWIVEEARRGRTVVRLKGGDPLVFGRGGEEALACHEAGIAFELVPGISSPLGAASCAGIPLTHRHVASSVAFATAHADRSGEGGSSLAALARAADTLVIFMGGSRLQAIADSLMADGISPEFPVAVISNATLENQQTVLSTLDCMAERAAAAGLTTPSLIILGEVTNLSPHLNWFEKQQFTAEAQSPQR